VVITVDLEAAPARVGLDEPEDCGRFHVAVRGQGDEQSVGQALLGAGVGRPAGEDHVWIDLDAIRRLAGGRVGPQWETEFAAMLAFAKNKGWLDGAGTAVQAHIERTRQARR